MDETEVQVEIACWAQDHPEASTINWKNGNEPWVTFSGKLCTLHVGLGGLIWKIEVPSGYQTQVDPGDGKRKRLWEPLDFHDTVIVQSRNTPFHVSVVDHSNNVIDLSSGLERDFAEKVASLMVRRGSEKDETKQKVHDMLKNLQVQSREDSAESAAGSNVANQALIISNACFASLEKAETLAEVLDAIHGFAKLYNLHCSWVRKTLQPSLTMGAGHSGSGDELHDDTEDYLSEDDAEPFRVIKWSWIRAQVNYAAEACAHETCAASYPEDWNSELDLDNSLTILKLGEGLHNLEISCPPLITNPVESDTDEEYTVISPRAAATQLNDDTTVFDAFRILSSDSESEVSDSSWENANLSEIASYSQSDFSELDNHDLKLEDSREVTRNSIPLPLSPQHKRNVYGASQSQVSRRPSFFKPILKRPQGDHDRSSIYVERRKELQWCDIEFNPVSFSVECTIRLNEFMDNPAAAVALGLDLEHPLRVEIVPNKADVDALSWNGAVEVNVSQHSDWHNHISEDICGLLCLVPYIVRTYFHLHVPDVMRQRLRQEPKGDLFVGVLQTIVRRLVNINAGGSCCVCAEPAERPSFLYMIDRTIWSCSDNLCRAIYATWLDVSSVDTQERERDENLGLRLIEVTLREDYPYYDRNALKSALETYSVNTDGLDYGKMIRALARIELWNEKDRSTTPADDTLLRPNSQNYRKFKRAQNM